MRRIELVDRQARSARVYNFEVRGQGNYFVGDGEVLVHNCFDFEDFNQARDAALDWLAGHSFKAEQPTLGRLGSNAGKPIGMKSADASVGFRVEYDLRHGAHINVWSHKIKTTFTFQGDQSMVDQIVKRYQKENLD